MGTALTAMAMNGMLPTPTARNYKNGSKPEDGRTQRKNGTRMDNGIERSGGLQYAPDSDNKRLQGFHVSQWDDAEKREIEERYSKQYPCDEGGSIANNGLGKLPNSTPLFVAEMMGFPLMWTVLPFLSQNGGRNQSKDMETP